MSELETTEVEEAPAHERGLSDEERERRAGALALVRQYGDPVLRSAASEVSEFGPELAEEAERMIAIMRDAMGVGLAATQLGVLRRLLVFQAGADARPTALANPRIEWLSGDLAVAEEGCLSLPGIGVDVERSLHARVSGVDVEGAPLELEASGLEARVLQHEIDHLDGVLILDRTTPRAAQGRAAGAARGRDLLARGARTTSPISRTGEDRLPRHLGVRRHRPPPPRRLRSLPGARHRARPTPAPGAGAGCIRRRSPTAAGELGLELLQTADVNDDAVGRADRRGRGRDRRRLRVRPADPAGAARPSSSSSTSIRRCFRAGAARRRSSARSSPATRRPG